MRTCEKQETRNGEVELVVYSRKSGKRNGVVAETANPNNIKLRDRDTFTIRHGRQRFDQLEIIIEVLRSR